MWFFVVVVELGVSAEECRPDRFPNACGIFHHLWSWVSPGKETALPFAKYTWSFNPPGWPARGSPGVNACRPGWTHRWPCEWAPGKDFLLEHSFEEEGGDSVTAALPGWPCLHVFLALTCAWNPSPPSRCGVRPAGAAWSPAAGTPFPLLSWASSQGRCSAGAVWS